MSPRVRASGEAPLCQDRSSCVAKGKGHCRACNMASVARKLHADPEFAAAHAKRMRKLHADPEFAAANAERMRKLHADPEFAAANAKRMRKLHADPEFAAAHAERMRKLNADPEFAAANAERMRKLHADPEFAAANAKRMRKLNADRLDRKLAVLDETARECFARCVHDGLPQSMALDLARDDMAVRRRVRMRGLAVLA